MDDATRVASMQLSRMRGMTAMYHRRFFADVNLTTVLILVLVVVGFWAVPEAFLLIPVVALLGAVATAFDASYLTFARWYAAFLEDDLNHRIGRRVLVGGDLESAYLYELGTRKVVTVPIRGRVTWFSAVTIIYTAIGAFAYVFGLVLGWETLSVAPSAIGIGYLVGLIGLTGFALAVGMWWFVGGVGERRLSAVLAQRYGQTMEPVTGGSPL